MTVLRALRARLARWRNPGTGWCPVCGRPWGVLGCLEHIVWYSAHAGAFAVCVDCWPELSLDERIAAMRVVHGPRFEWGLIEVAVRDESDEDTLRRLSPGERLHLGIGTGRGEPDVAAAGEDGVWLAAAWKLKRLFPSLYGEKQ